VPAPERSRRASSPPAAAGYSGTPLAGKLGVKAGDRVLLWRAPAGWEIPELPQGVLVVRTGRQADVVIAFARAAGDVVRDVERLGRVVAPNGSLWLAWPRRAGGHVSDITDNLLREIALPLGLVDVKVAALDHDWSALKFMWRQERRRLPAGGTA